MKKRTFYAASLSGLFILLGPRLAAQTLYWGLNAGISLPSISGGNNELSQGYTTRLAPNFGIQAERSISERFSLQAELNFAGQGGKRKGIQPITDLPPQFSSFLPSGQYLYADFKNVSELNYLELPILAKWYWGQRFRVYAVGGPYVGYLLSARQKISGSSDIYADKNRDPFTIGGQPLPSQSFDTTINVISDIHRFNFGITAGAGVVYPAGKKEQLFFNVRFEYGLINIQKNSENGKNNTGNVLLTVGYARRFGQNK
jgi:nitrite reductase/ring-hydroxylating ferredoxin subunit